LKSSTIPETVELGSDPLTIPETHKRYPTISFNDTATITCLPKMVCRPARGAYVDEG